MAKRKNKPNKAQLSFLENYGNTAPAVPTIRDAVRDWRTMNMYQEPGMYTILVKVIDILENDTTKAIEVEV